MEDKGLVLDPTCPKDWKNVNIEWISLSWTHDPDQDNGWTDKFIAFVPVKVTSVVKITKRSVTVHAIDNPEDKKERPRKYVLNICDFEPTEDFVPTKPIQWRLLKGMD